MNQYWEWCLTTAGHQKLKAIPTIKETNVAPRSHAVGRLLTLVSVCRRSPNAECHENWGSESIVTGFLLVD
jgi:hypothetical protein